MSDWDCGAGNENLGAADWSLDFALAAFVLMAYAALSLVIINFRFSCNEAQPYGR